ncbi:MAG: hypothetical protein AABY14_01950 [Nanoarchaeota archaeon]
MTFYISNRESLWETFLVGDAHRQSLWHLLVILGDIIRFCCIW